jgi:hypothetical protein
MFVGPIIKAQKPLEGSSLDGGFDDTKSGRFSGGGYLAFKKSKRL